MGLYLLSTLCELLFFMEMTVLRSSALRCLHIERGVREAAGLVGNVLTSVICVCLSGTRQHHRERDTHSPESDRSWSPLCISGRRRRRDVGGGGGYTVLIPTHMHWHAHREIHTSSESMTARLGSVISTLYLLLSSDFWEFYLKPKRCNDLSLYSAVINDPPV